MQIVNFLFSTLLFISISLSAGAQALDLFSNTSSFSNATTDLSHYKDYTAIFYKGSLLADEFPPKGARQLEAGMKGTLMVATAKRQNGKTTPVKNIEFLVAIKNGRTNTTWMYSPSAMREVQLEDILKKCEPGDRIIFITVDRQFSLPYNEIQLNLGGC